MLKSGCLCRDCESFNAGDHDDEDGWCDDYEIWFPYDHGCTAGVPRPDAPRRYTVVMDVPELLDMNGPEFLPSQKKRIKLCNPNCPKFNGCEFWRPERYIPGPGCPRYETPEEGKV